VILADLHPIIETPEESDDSGAGADDHTLSNFVPGFDFVDPTVRVVNASLGNETVRNGTSEPAIKTSSKPDVKKGSSASSEIQKAKSKNRA